MVPPSNECRRYNDSLAKHITERKTEGRIIEICWHEEPGYLSHEYLLFCVASDIPENDSWMRAERNGNLATGMELVVPNPFDVANGGLTITFAKTKEELYNRDGDKAIKSLSWVRHHVRGKPIPPPLHDIVRLLLVIDQEHGYTFTLFNCWWFARETFSMVVEQFWGETPELRDLIKRKERNHLAAHSASSATLPVKTGPVIGAGLLLWSLVPVVGPSTIIAGQYASGSIRFDINHGNIKRKFHGRV
jgi:hypothetical protein